MGLLAAGEWFFFMDLVCPCDCTSMGFHGYGGVLKVQWAKQMSGEKTQE